MWFSLKKIIPFTIEKLGINKKKEQLKIFDIWNTIINCKYQNKTTPFNLKGDILFIKCANSILANELKLNEKKILLDINDKRIQQIKFIC